MPAPFLNQELVSLNKKQLANNLKSYEFFMLIAYQPSTGQDPKM